MFFVKNSVIMAWIIVIIMLGSTIGFGILSGGNNSSPPVGNLPPVQEPTALSFKAESDANVSELLPSILITADTNEVDLGKINAELASIIGVDKARNFDSLFPQQPSSSNEFFLSFVSTISFDPKLSSFEVFSKIKSDSNYLKNMQGVLIGLVRVPSNVVFHNADLNLDKNHFFSNRLVQAYLSLNSLPNDAIAVSLDAVFKGEEISELKVFELRNNSAVLSTKTVSLKSRIAELEPLLLVSSEAGFSDRFDVNELKDFIVSDDVNNAEFSFANINPVLIASVDSNFSEKENDLNSIVSSLTDLNSFSINFSENKTNIKMVFFDSIVSLTEKIIDFKKKLRDANFDANEFVVKQEQGFFSGKVDLNSFALAFVVSEKMKAWLSDKNIAPKIYQPGKISIEKILNDDTNSYFVLDFNSLNIQLLPRHHLGEEITAKLNLFVQRNKVLFAQGEEAEQ